MEQRRTNPPLRRSLGVALCSLLLACSVDHAADGSDDAALTGQPPDAATMSDAQTPSSADASSSSTDAAAAESDAAACPGSRCRPPAEAGAADTGASPAADAGPNPRSDAGTPAHTDAGGESCTPFPSFDRSCSTDTDCAIGTRTVNCCGTLIATGIRKSDEARFRATVTKCQAGQPICDCLSGPTRADDGSVDDFTNSAFLRASCVAGECWTSYHGLGTRTACGNAGMSCDFRSEICVISPMPNGDAVARCAALPAGCERDRTCGCVSAGVCRSGDACSQEQRANTVRCSCATCL